MSYLLQEYIEVEAPLNTTPDTLSESGPNNGCTSVHTSLGNVFASEDNDAEDKDEVPVDNDDEDKSSEEKSGDNELVELDANSPTKPKITRRLTT